MVAKVRKSKKSVSVALVRDAVAALSERNGSSVKSIFNYLVWNRQAGSGARKQVIVAIRKAVKAGVLTKKSGKGFVASGKASKPTKRSVKRKTKKRAARKVSKKSSRARRRRGVQKKRKARKSSKRRKSSKKVKKSSVKRARKLVKPRKPKSANNAKPLPKMSARPRRKCTIGIRYTA